MSSGKSEAAREWRDHWTLVFASTLALSLTTIASFSMGLFMEPLSHEFGWSRAEITSGLTIFSLIAFPLSPFAGALVDRIGARRVGLPGIVLSGIAFSLFGLMTGSLTLWWGAWLLYGFVALGIKSLVWTAAVSSVFQSGRGLALAVMMCGSAIGSGGVPLLSNWLIDAYGWRSAFAVIGLGWSAVVLAVAVPFFFDARDRARTAPAGTVMPERVVPRGLAIPDAWRDPSLRKLSVALTLISGLLVAMMVHLVPILGERGIPRGTAAGIVSLLGAIAIPSKLSTGWLIDRVPVGLVTGLTFLLPIVPCAAFLWLPHSLPALIGGTLALGWSSGAYFHLSSYLTSRYAGLLNFGKVYGFLTSLIVLSTGLSPMVAGAVFDHTGSYDLVLFTGFPVALLCGGLMLTLARFPDWSPLPAASPA